MDDLVWILHDDQGSAFGTKGVSGSYILPKQKMDIPPESIPGKRIWVVLRNHEDRLLMLIKAKKIEKIVDGYYKDDYIIKSDLSQSIKFVDGYTSAEKYQIGLSLPYKIGIWSITSLISNAFIKIVRANVQTKLLAPTQTVLSGIGFKTILTGNRSLARNAIYSVVSTLTLDKIWASGMGKKLEPYANFASALLAYQKDTSVSSNLELELKAIDPIHILQENVFSKSIKNTREKTLPEVDLEFSEIEPEKIYAREFLPIAKKSQNLEDALSKTEHSEKIHQEMLKDVVIFLMSKNVTTYESCSIDLMYKLENGLHIFEIKSSNAENILSQAAKGVFQIVCYLNALDKEYTKLHPYLVLRKTGNNDIDAYVKEVIEPLGITVLFYNPENPWPERIDKLPI